MNNLEWLYEHDREAMFDMVACGDKNCCECGMAKYYPDCDLDENGTRREWMLSEHVDGESCNQVADQREHTETPHASKWQSNDAQSDSREKLEAEVRKWCGMYPYQVDMVWVWLNRQAEITERETEKKWSSFSDSVDGHIAKLQSGHDRTVTALERANAEIAELQDQLESAHVKNRALKAHITKMQEGRHGWHIKGKELQQQVDSLKRKLESATDANTDYRDEWHRVCAERANLARDLGNAMAERDHYRELCGKLLDAADDMRRVRDAFDQFERCEV